MALWLTAVNIFTDKQDAADYKVQVGINKYIIWEGLVEGHYRPNGAAYLLELIGKKMREDELKGRGLVDGAAILDVL